MNPSASYSQDTTLHFSPAFDPFMMRQSSFLLLLGSPGLKFKYDAILFKPIQTNLPSKPILVPPMYQSSVISPTALIARATRAFSSGVSIEAKWPL